MITTVEFMLAVCFTGIIVALIELVRNKVVYQFRIELIREYHLRWQREIDSWYHQPNRTHEEIMRGPEKSFDRYNDWFDNELLSYNLMVLYFWVPCKQFLKETPMPEEIKY